MTSPYSVSPTGREADPGEELLGAALAGLVDDVDMVDCRACAPRRAGRSTANRPTPRPWSSASTLMRQSTERKCSCGCLGVEVRADEADDLVGVQHDALPGGLRVDHGRRDPVADRGEILLLAGLERHVVDRDDRRRRQFHESELSHEHRLAGIARSAHDRTTLCDAEFVGTKYLDVKILWRCDRLERPPERRHNR